jgi:hypothetical protein
MYRIKQRPESAVFILSILYIHVKLFFFLDHMYAAIPVTRSPITNV